MCEGKQCLGLLGSIHKICNRPDISSRFKMSGDRFVDQVWLPGMKSEQGLRHTTVQNLSLSWTQIVIDNPSEILMSQCH